MTKAHDKDREDLDVDPAEQDPVVEDPKEDDLVKIPKKDFDNLKRNLAKANKSDEKRRKELEAYSRFGEPSDIEALLEKAESVDHSGVIDDEVINKKLEKQRKELERKFQQDLAAKDEALTATQRRIEETIFLAQAREMVTKHEGVPELVLDPIRRATKVIEQDGSYKIAVVDEDGDPRFNNRGEYMGLEDLVLELKEHDIYGRGFSAPEAKSGVGVRNQGEGARKGDPTHGMKKSDMSIQQREAFIAKHGFAEYKKIQD